MKYRMVRLGLVLLLVIALLTSICGFAEEASADPAGMEASVDEALVAEEAGEVEATPRDLVILLYNPPSATINFAESITLTATVAAAGQPVTWTSSDENVAEVHPNGDGSVTVVGVGEGTATIACTLDDQTQTYAVTVNPPQTLLISDVEYPSDLRISGLGWSLRRGSIASIDDLKTLTSAIKDASGEMITEPYTQTFEGGVKSFKIRGIDRYVPFGSITEAGQYIWMLTATDASGRSVTVNLPIQAEADGETVVSRAAAKCAPVIRVPDQDGGNAIALQAGEKKGLTVTQLPGDAGNGVIWVSYDPAVATVSPEGEITGVGAGTTTVICRTLDNTGFSAGCTVTVNAAAAPAERNEGAESLQNNGGTPIQGDGVNMLRGTNNINIAVSSWPDSTWGAFAGDDSCIKAVAFDVTDAPSTNIHKGVRMTTPDGVNTYNGIGQNFIPAEIGQTYTISCYARITKGSGECKCQFDISFDGGEVTHPASKTEIGPNWTKCSYTYTVPANGSELVFGGGIHLVSTSGETTMEVCGMKLERGGVPTEWTPAPEDAGND